MALQAGTQAPDFTLRNFRGGEVTLSQLLRQDLSVILSFFPATESSAYECEIAFYQSLLCDFEQLDATVVGISEDDIPSFQTQAEQHDFTFPLLSDSHPKGNIASKYGVLRTDEETERAIFIIDPDGIIRYSSVLPSPANPEVDWLFDALEQMAEEKNNDGRDAVQGAISSTSVGFSAGSVTQSG